MDFQNHSTSYFDGWLCGDEWGMGFVTSIDYSHILLREGRPFPLGSQDWRSRKRMGLPCGGPIVGVVLGLSICGNPLWSGFLEADDDHFYKEVSPLNVDGPPLLRWNCDLTSSSTHGGGHERVSQQLKDRPRNIDPNGGNWD